MMTRRKRSARWYRRHPEQALREVSSFDGRLQKGFLDALADDEEAMRDLGMKLGDLRCPWHPGLTLFECRPLHEAVTARTVPCESCGTPVPTDGDDEDHPPGYWLCDGCAGKS